MPSRHPLSNISEIPNRGIFFDANVLIYLFWPTGSYRWESSYSAAFSALLKQQNKLFVDFLVISEIINRAHRIEYEKYLANQGLTKRDFSYKDFRDCAEGETALSEIFLIIDDYILPRFSIVGKIITKEDIQSFLTIDILDFVDKAILSICRENEFILCTNDRDYRSAEVDILTSNPAILNK